MNFNKSGRGARGNRGRGGRGGRGRGRNNWNNRPRPPNQKNFQHAHRPPFKPGYHRFTFPPPSFNVPPPLLAPRPASPLPGTEEYRQRNIQETSELIKRQLQLDGASSEDLLLFNEANQNHKASNDAQETEKDNISQVNPTTPSTKKNKTRKSKNVESYEDDCDVEEIHNKIIKHISKLSYSKKINFVYRGLSGYEGAVQKLQMQKRLELSRALRDMSNKTTQDSKDCEVINSIIPDIGIKIEDLPREIIAKLSSTLGIELNQDENTEFVQQVGAGTWINDSGMRGDNFELGTCGNESEIMGSNFIMGRNGNESEPRGPNFESGQYGNKISKFSGNYSNKIGGNNVDEIGDYSSQLEVWGNENQTINDNVNFGIASDIRDNNLKITNEGRCDNLEIANDTRLNNFEITTETSCDNSELGIGRGRARICDIKMKHFQSRIERGRGSVFEKDSHNLDAEIINISSVNSESKSLSSLVRQESGVFKGRRFSNSSDEEDVLDDLINTRNSSSSESEPENNEEANNSHPEISNAFVEACHNIVNISPTKANPSKPSESESNQNNCDESRNLNELASEKPSFPLIKLRPVKDLLECSDDRGFLTSTEIPERNKLDAPSNSNDCGYDASKPCKLNDTTLKMTGYEDTSNKLQDLIKTPLKTKKLNLNVYNDSTKQRFNKNRNNNLQSQKCPKRNEENVPIFSPQTNNNQGIHTSNSSNNQQTNNGKREVQPSININNKPNLSLCSNNKQQIQPSININNQQTQLSININNQQTQPAIINNEEDRSSVARLKVRKDLQAPVTVKTEQIETNQEYVSNRVITLDRCTSTRIVLGKTERARLKRKRRAAKRAGEPRTVQITRNMIRKLKKLGKHPKRREGDLISSKTNEDTTTKAESTVTSLSVTDYDEEYDEATFSVEPSNVDEAETLKESQDMDDISSLEDFISEPASQVCVKDAFCQCVETKAETISSECQTDRVEDKDVMEVKGKREKRKKLLERIAKIDEQICDLMKMKRNLYGELLEDDEVIEKEHTRKRKCDSSHSGVSSSSKKSCREKIKSTSDKPTSSSSHRSRKASSKDSDKKDSSKKSSSRSSSSSKTKTVKEKVESNTDKIRDNEVLYNLPEIPVIPEDVAESEVEMNGVRLSSVSNTVGESHGNLSERNNCLDFRKWEGSILVIEVKNNNVLSGNDKGICYVHDLNSGKLLEKFQLGKLPVTSICFSEMKEDQHFYVGTFEGRLHSIDTRSKQSSMSFYLDENPVQCMDRNWGYFFIGSIKGNLLRFNISKSKIEDTVSISRDSVLVIRAVQEGARRVVLIATRNSPIMVRDAMSGLLMRTMESTCVPTVYTLLFHDNKVYCGTSQQDILVYTFQNGEFSSKYSDGKSSGVVCMKIVHNILFAGCYNGNIYAYNTKTNKFIASMVGPPGLFLSMAATENEIIIGTKQNNFKALKIPQCIKKEMT